MKRHAWRVIAAACISALFAGHVVGTAQAETEGVAASGEVNIYSYRQPYLIEPLFDKFTEATGIKVNVVFAKRGLAERIEAEGANSPADLILTTDIARLTGVVEKGITQPVTSPSLQNDIPARYRDPDNHWFGLTVRSRVIYASRERVPEGEVTSYEALAGPAWKDRVCVRSGTNNYNIALLASIIAHHGEAYAKQWLLGLKDNLARKPQGNDRAQIKAVAQGECDVAIGNTYYYAVMLADPAQRPAADAVRMVFPNQTGDGLQGRGAHVNLSGMAMARHAPNRENAQAAMEFLASAEAQRIYAEVNNEYPVKPGVPWSELVQSWGMFTADELPLAEIARHRIRAIELVNETGFDD